ncbi:glycosyltransferase [Catelliglobosispora koreensis]|uniref:glycosyltransferase n=1 Tax=Catelliglobosispora koreensis TaxID=129052 RepID=UPI0003611DEB|nr:glycosyltransferase [Catelliglobosispora koreensis]
MSGAPVVGILRHQQFQPSETFIRSQALALDGFSPLFIGRDPLRSSDLPAISVADFGKRAIAAYTLTGTCRPLVSQLARRGTVLIHAHFGVEGAYAVKTATALNVPLVTTLHGFDVTISKRQLVASKRLSWLNYVAWRKSLFSKAAAFVCVSSYIRQRAIEWGYPADRTVLLPIGVDTDLIQPSPPQPERPTIVHVARLVEVKGTALLIKAFERVRKQVRDASMVIVGDGPLRPQLQSLTSELGLSDSIEFTGALPHAETLRVIAQASVFCLPSVTAANGAQEGLGLVLLEAAAAGKPVVGTLSGGIPEAVRDGINGFLVPERDKDALADRLITLLADTSLCRQFGLAGRAMVEAEYNLGTQNRRLEALYRSLL